MYPATSYDKFAQAYDKAVGNDGDYFHKNTCDPTLLKVIGDYRNKIIYDIGCGNGYLSRYLANKGAKEVWASDVSKNLIDIAEKRYPNPDNKIRYMVRKAINFQEIPVDYFNLVFMNMVIHYIDDVAKLMEGIGQILKIKGRFVFTSYNPVYPLAKEELGEGFGKVASLIEEIEKYFVVTKGKKKNNWAKGQDLDFFYRPISYYVNILSKNNLLIDKLLEPKTVRQSLEGKTVASAIPGMIAVGAIKVSR